MDRYTAWGRRAKDVRFAVAYALWAGVAVSGCGGGDTGTQDASGPNKTYLSVSVDDPDNDALHYSWRVTAGSVVNKDAKETVWTMPDGPGLHFAYVVVSDGKGGYVEQQYAVATDALNVPSPIRDPIVFTPTAIVESGDTMRVIVTAGAQAFTDPSAPSATVPRIVYLPDAQLTLKDAAGMVVATSTTDLRGEAVLTGVPLAATPQYTLQCRLAESNSLRDCSGTPSPIAVSTAASTLQVSPTLPASQNLRLFGHVALADGAVCGLRNRFAGIESAGTVQLVDVATGAALTNEVRINSYGDYALNAAVAADAKLQLRVRCEAMDERLDLAPDANGYSSSRPRERSHIFSNSRPRILQMVANGPDGNVRGKMIVPDANAGSNGLPGADHFLTFKGIDTRLSSCRYYASIGAAGDCDAQGNPGWTITLDDWKRARKLSPYNGANSDVSAIFINRHDLNLVRRMFATSAGADDIAFYVCNHPGPDTQSQAEIDLVLGVALAAQKQVACVAMEHTVSPGANGNQPFTKFLTFGPDGRLILSINLDGRGEKFMPGACVACHGGSNYIGRFAESGSPSPYLGSHFLPFDTNNYLFGSQSGLSEDAQGAALRGLNGLVRMSEARSHPAGTAVTRLIDGWYEKGGNALDKEYVPTVWSQYDGVDPGAAAFYKQVVGTTCRTCHDAMEQSFDWDGPASPAPGTKPTLLLKKDSANICGKSSDLRVNGSMANALTSYDRLVESIETDPVLLGRMNHFLGCATPGPDPAYPKR